MRHRLQNTAIGAMAMLISTLPSVTLAQSGSASVDTRMNLFSVPGNPAMPAAGGQPGIVPLEILLNAGTGRILRVDASGTATFCPNAACGTANPDGPSIGGTNVNSSGNIAGLLAPTSGFLAGVFLSSSVPVSAPTRLDFNVLSTTFLSLTGLQLGQTFFIGDGFSGATQQLFYVPDGATRLLLGIVDGSGFGGDPGYYDDNVGTYTARYSITGATTVPEPSTIALMGVGLAAMLFVSRRRNA